MDVYWHCHGGLISHPAISMQSDDEAPLQQSHGFDEEGGRPCTLHVGYVLEVAEESLLGWAAPTPNATNAKSTSRPLRSIEKAVSK